MNKIELTNLINALKNATDAYNDEKAKRIPNLKKIIILKKAVETLQNRIENEGV